MIFWKSSQNIIKIKNMSTNIYICHGNCGKCMWCSKPINRGSNMIRFNGFTFDIISEFIDQLLQHKNLIKGLLINKEFIIDNIIPFIIDVSHNNSFNLFQKYFHYEYKYCHHNCGVAEIIQSSNFSKHIKKNSIVDLMKTKYGREIKPVEKFQNISFVPGSGVSGCDQYDRGFGDDIKVSPIVDQRLVNDLKDFVVDDDATDADYATDSEGVSLCDSYEWSGSDDECSNSECEFSDYDSEC